MELLFQGVFFGVVSKDGVVVSRGLFWSCFKGWSCCFKGSFLELFQRMELLFQGVFFGVVSKDRVVAGIDVVELCGGGIGVVNGGGGGGRTSVVVIRISSNPLGLSLL